MRTSNSARWVGRHRVWPIALDVGLVLLTLAVATALRLAIGHMVGAALPFVTYFIAALVLAWFCGFWPAALCIGLSAVVGEHVILGPKYSGFLAGQSRRATVIGFMVTSFAVSFMIDFQHRTSRRAKNAERAQAAVASENAWLLAQAQQSHRELQHSNEELRRANRDLEIFAYSATHDLREPLRNVAIFTELLQNNGTEPGAEERYLPHVLAGARRANALIDDLLAYMRATKIDNGPAPGVEASAVLAEAVETLRGQIDAAAATVTSTELPCVLMHRVCLLQVFQNLIGNSLKYRRADAPVIHISAVTEDVTAVFSIADNGLGLEPAYGETIFGLFKRLHPADQYPGNGIGLTICQRLVEHHEGRIWLEDSKPGVGSTFCFSAPVSASQLRKPRSAAG